MTIILRVWDLQSFLKKNWHNFPGGQFGNVYVKPLKTHTHIPSYSAIILLRIYPGEIITQVLQRCVKEVNGSIVFI